ncbi:UNKNOWN [Stylonychia lemnae]|uniref:Uncharacterized protein n=1 Tax=Stylonychia lemnae TaxID=5949 RepID=A0A077ZV71_STYLE|nr:UNKNOWN [Stylonychia lemnae]|eukprot:CDW73514.1 UNKNOWN [Stylonychia lemnae]
MKSIQYDQTAYAKLCKSISQLSSIKSQLANINDRFKTYQLNANDCIHESISNHIIKLGSQIFSSKAGQKLQASENDLLDFKNILQIIEISQSFIGIQTNLSKLLFSKQLEKLTYHYLRSESELYSTANPEWLFKYMLEQLQSFKDKFIKIIGDDIDQLIDIYVRIVAQQIVLVRYNFQREILSENSNGMNVKEVNLKFLNTVINYDHLILKLNIRESQELPITILGLMIEQDQIRHEVIELLKNELIEIFTTQYNNLYEEKGQILLVLKTSSLQKLVTANLQRFEIYSESVRREVLLFYLENVIKVLKNAINEQEYLMLDLATKSHFNQFTDTLRELRQFKKEILNSLTCNNQLKQDINSLFDYQLLNKLNQLVITHFEAKVIPQRDQSDFNTQLILRLKAYFAKIYQELQGRVTAKWAIKVTIQMLMRIKKDIEQILSQFRKDDYATIQTFKELKFDLNLIMDQYSFDFKF